MTVFKILPISLMLILLTCLNSKKITLTVCVRVIFGTRGIRTHDQGIMSPLRYRCAIVPIFAKPCASTTSLKQYIIKFLKNQVYFYFRLIIIKFLSYNSSSGKLYSIISTTSPPKRFIVELANSNSSFAFLDLYATKYPPFFNSGNA